MRYYMQIVERKKSKKNTLHQHSLIRHGKCTEIALGIFIHFFWFLKILFFFFYCTNDTTIKDVLFFNMFFNAHLFAICCFLIRTHLQNTFTMLYSIEIESIPVDVIEMTVFPSIIIEILLSALKLLSKKKHTRGHPFI